MTEYRTKDVLRVRDVSPEDIPVVNAYWKNQTPADVERLSLDPSKITTRLLQPSALDELVKLPYPQRTNDLLIWELNERAVGMSSLRNIRYEEYGEIHLHMIEPQFRWSGYGHRFFVLSLQEYVRRFSLKIIVCEPSSENPAPNRLLQKLGFTIARTYRATPSDINHEHQVNRYEIKPELMTGLGSWLSAPK